MKFRKNKFKKNDVINKQPESNLSDVQNGINKAKSKKSNIKQNSATEISRSSSKNSINESKPIKVNECSLSESISSDEDDDNYFDGTSTEGDANSLSCQQNDDVESQKKSCFKLKQNHDPIVYSCCGCCSLGAGSLLTGVLYIGFCIGFMVYRINDFKTVKPKVTDAGKNLYKDIWRYVLIGGIGSASISMLGALILLISSCIFGQKEHFSKIQKAIITWCCVTAFTILCNVGEGVYVIMIPTQLQIRADSGIIIHRFNYENIKSQLPTIFGLTSVHAVFYIYLVIVLVSYLRLLKYKSAPKVGNDHTATEDNQSSGKPGTNLSTSVITSEADEGIHELDDSLPNRKIKKTKSIPKRNQPNTRISTNQNSFQLTSNTYINWPVVENEFATESSSCKDGNNGVVQSVPEASVNNPLTEHVYDETPVEENHVLPVDSTAKLEEPKQRIEEHKTIEDSTLTLSKPGLLDSQIKVTSNASKGTVSSADSVKSCLTQHNMKQQETLKKAFPETNKKIVMKSQSEQKRKKESDTKKPQVEPQAVTSFFKTLVNESESSNPIEEMFRLFGGDLCSKHPENCERYLKSYKDIRSKTSHITSPRDPYEFERLGATTLPQPPPEFPLNPGSTASSVYGPTSFGHLPSRHSSHCKVMPDPVYGSRLPSRDLSRKPFDYFRNDSRLSSRIGSGVQNYPAPHYQDSVSNPYSIYSSFGHDQSLYYDDSCSTCYGEYIYGDCSDCYSFQDFYPLPQGPRLLPSHPTSHFSHPSLKSTRSYNQSKSQFSVTSDFRQPSVAASNPPTWIPIGSEQEYSVYPSTERTLNRSMSKSLPSLVESKFSRRSSFVTSDSNSNILSPEFTLPSPREVNRLNRSASWCSSMATGRRDKKERYRGRPLSRTKSVGSCNSRNYSGYHTGDLRRKTSHTAHSHLEATESRSFSNRNKPAASSQAFRSRPPSRRSQSEFDEFSATTSNFLTSSQPTRTQIPFRPTSRSSRNIQSFSQSSTRSRRTSGNHDLYPDKHINLRAPSSRSSKRTDFSLDGSSAVTPYSRQSQRLDPQKKASFHRSRSVRYPAESRTSSFNKQVNFGSTPDLHLIQRSW